jgi:hypothetical protein
MRGALLVLSLLILANCGLKRPIMPPKDIPAYQEKLRKKRERLQDDKAPADADQSTDGSSPPATPADTPATPEVVQ